jgi:CRP/FNR family cyclic AMP-dependent transcriptional regulator
MPSGNGFPMCFMRSQRRLGNALKTQHASSQTLPLLTNGRIHRSLIQLTLLPEAMTHPDGMQIRVTRQELGKLVGCSREMAGRVLKMLEGDGYITVAGKTIVVLREPANSSANRFNQ